MWRAVNIRPYLFVFCTIKDTIWSEWRASARMLLTSWCPSSRVRGRPRMSFGHTIKKFIIKLNDKLDDPDAKAWDPTLTGRDARKEQWRWTELASEKNKWQVIIQRTEGWREREKEVAEAKTAAARVRSRAARSRGAQAGGGRYAAAAPPPTAGNSRGARAQLPAIIHELKRFSSRGDIGTNPSIIFHITRRSDR